MKKKKGRGVVVVAQTDIAGHWQLDPLFEAIENSNRRAMQEPMDRCHVPIAPELESEELAMMKIRLSNVGRRLSDATRAITKN